MLRSKSIHEKMIVECFGKKVRWDEPRPAFDCDLAMLGFTNRCGSNMTAELLRRTGIFAGLRESLNGPAVQKVSEKNGLSSFPDFIKFTADSEPDAPIFGFKVNHAQLEMVCRWKIPKMFRGAKVLHVVRSDLVAQAVSYSIADQTKQWTSEQKGSGIKPEFNYDDIMIRLKGIAPANADIAKIASKYGLPRLELNYEHVVADRTAAIAQVCEFFGHTPRGQIEMQERFQKQGDGLNDEFIARFMEEARKRDPRALAKLTR
ncbi:Stf0 family sulfotransferase [Actibacterium lipolyticum]|uniref:Stf0 sulfotransferase n=1 Tax=Actibacterium lipolyticum TaxID=1524263 RepID=A0A238KIW6_9RHOB|nr:Stf0 family sulfotransferase [Actibacterium lipolyticum]SMX42809.1 Stf0 sulfotransferase [Actibacterium lipolyticum]